jgi:hypothetical protein
MSTLREALESALSQAETTEEPISAAGAPESTTTVPEGSTEAGTPPAASVEISGQESSSQNPADTKPVEHSAEPNQETNLAMERGPDGKFVPKKTAADPAAAKTEPKAPATESLFPEPPVSWKKEAKEAWKDLPEMARREVIRRERDIDKALSQAAPARKFADDFHKTIAPYTPYLQTRGTTPLEAIDSVMRTAAGLVQGSPVQKADIIADLISEYGVDLRVLDAALTSNLKNPRPRQQVQQMPDLRNHPQLAPVFQVAERLSSVEQQRAQALEQQASQAVETLAQKEFFEEVQDDLADILELAAKSNRKITLDEAYDRACQLHPQVSKIIAQRKEAEAAAAARASAEQARRAASSIAGAPSGDGTRAGPKDRRDVIASAFK